MNIGKLERFLLFFSATDIDCISECSAVEVHHQASVGAAVLLSSAYAFAACYYATFTLFGSEATAIGLGVLWGGTVMTLNRLLVSSFGSTSNSAPEMAALRHYVAPLVLRLMLALILGFTVAVPLELRIAQKEIFDELVQRERANRSKAAQNKIDEASSNAAADIERHKLALTDLRTLEEEAGKYDKQLRSDIKDEVAKCRVAGILTNTITKPDGSKEVVTKPVKTRECVRAEEIRDSTSRSFEDVQLRRGEVRKEVALLETALHKNLLRQMQQKQLSDPQIVDPATDREFLEGLKSTGFVSRFSVLRDLMTRDDRAQFLVSWSVRILLVLVEMLPVLIWLLGGELFYNKVQRFRDEERVKRLKVRKTDSAPANRSTDRAPSADSAMPSRL